jgi:hypothetical protein
VEKKGLIAGKKLLKMMGDGYNNTSLTGGTLEEAER